MLYTLQTVFMLFNFYNKSNTSFIFKIFFLSFFWGGGTIHSILVINPFHSIMHYIVPGTINTIFIISLGEDHAFKKSELDFHWLTLKYFTLPKE